MTSVAIRCALTGVLSQRTAGPPIAPSEHFIGEASHLRVAALDFSCGHVGPQVEGFLARCREVGDRGVVVGYLSGAACPIHHMTHTDGENRRLLPLYLEAGFDIADSVCPYPMTQCRLEDIYAAFAGRITIWGGIPSTLLCPDSTSDAEFRRTIDSLVARYSGQSRLILGVSDMVTADADWERLGYITGKVG